MVKKIGFSIGLVLLVGVGLLVIQRAFGVRLPGSVAFEILVLAPATYFLSLVLASYRLYITMVPRNPNGSAAAFAPLLDLTILHDFLLVFLPARAADVYYPFLVAARGRTTIGAAVGNLVLLRIIDLAAIASIVAVMAPWISFGGFQSGALSGLAGAVVIAAAAAVISLDRVLGIFLAAVVRPARAKAPIWRKLFWMLASARRWFGSLGLARRLWLYGVSLAAWCACALTYCIIFKGLGLDYDIVRSMFAGLATELGAVLPVQTVAGLGAGEGVLTAVFVAYGLPLSQAAVTAVWCRLTSLASIAAIFVLRGCVLILRHRSGRDNVIALLFGRTGAIDPPPRARETRGTFI